MKTKRFLILIFICCVMLISCNKSSDEASIKIEYRPGINFVTHLYTMAGIGFYDSLYVAEHGASVSTEDIALLKEKSSLLAFANGQSGVLAQFFFFMPAYSNLDTSTEYQDYLLAIESAAKDKSELSLLKYAPGYNHEDLEYICSENSDGSSALASLMSDIRAIMEVYINNIDSYMDNVYPGVEVILEERAGEYSSLLGENTIIADWVSSTSYKWEKGDYTYLLFAAGKIGPSFNNLSENMNSLYYKLDTEYTLDMFSHEFGIFLMFDSIMPLYEEFQALYPPYESKYTYGMVNWMAFEMLVSYFNCNISNRKTRDYYDYTRSDPVAFMSIYDDLQAKGITDPVSMYSQAVEVYMDPEKGYWNRGVDQRYKELLRQKGRK